jgi:hypothetical protein
MKKIITLVCLGLAMPIARGQETNEVEQLKQQLQQMQENFEKAQREEKAQIDALTKKLDELSKSPGAGLTNAGPTNGGSTNAVSPDEAAEKKKLEEQLTVELQQNQAGSTNTAPAETASPYAGWSPSAPLTVARAGSAYMNISFDVLMDVGGSTANDPSAFLQLGDHDPIKNGFSLRNAEIAVDGAVDPYFKGFGNIVLKLDQNNETEIELEEAYLLSTSLPANLQVKAGQFFANFGRQNSQHPHQWAFVDAPIILTRAFGPDGLRSIAAQVSWLAPTPFFTELSVGAFDGQGGTSFSFRNPGGDDGTGPGRFMGRETIDRTLQGLDDVLYVTRLSSSFDVTDEQTLVAGISAALGPNDTGPSTRTEVYGTDLYWKWKPSNAGAGFPFVSWQTEALYRRFEAGADPAAALPAETLKDWGFYSQVLWGFKPRWVAGLRGEYANGNDTTPVPGEVFRGERTRVSPVVTFYPSEFSKIRLQYNYDHGAQFGDEHSVWLQMEFLLGAHGAHKF